MRGIVSTIVAGTFAASFGLTGLGNDDFAVQQQQMEAAFEPGVPQVSDIGSLGTDTRRAEIQSEVSSGVRQLDRSMRQAPVYAFKVARNVEEHGIAALAYSDPVLERQGKALGTEIGQGIRHFAVALGKDLVLAVKESGVHVR